jgi:hypothetical protein
MTTPCSACLPRPIPLSRPLPLRWASTAWEDLARAANWLVTHASVVHMHPWARWGSGQSGLAIEPGAAPAHFSADDAAALDDRLLRDIGAPEWVRAEASARRAAQRGAWADRAALDEVMMRAGRGWW